MSHDHDLTDEQIEARRIETEKRIEEARARIVEVGLIREGEMGPERDLPPGAPVLVGLLDLGGRHEWVAAVVSRPRVEITQVELDPDSADPLKDLVERVIKTVGSRRAERMAAQAEPKPPPTVKTVPLPEGLTLINAKVSHNSTNTMEGLAGEIAGHWDLAGYKVLGGVEDWPFGQEIVDRVEIDQVYPLVSVLPGGRICLPKIPTFPEASEWIRDRKIRTPGMVCGCGQVHSGPGLAVGMTSHHDPSSKGMGHNSVNLTVIHDDGSSGHAHPARVLNLRDCLLLKAVEAPDTAEQKAKNEAFQVKHAGARERKQARLARKFAAQDSQGVADDDVN